MTTSVAPVFASTPRTFCHVVPPSFVRYRPRSSFGPKRCPTAATKTMFASRGSMTMRPIVCVSRAPCASTSCRRRSTGRRRRPRWSSADCSAHPSPPKRRGIARRNRDVADRHRAAELSNTGSQVVPLFLLRNTPPDADATKMMRGSLGTASMSSTRPPNAAGPMCAPTRVARPRLRPLSDEHGGRRQEHPDQEKPMSTHGDGEERGYGRTGDDSAGVLISTDK